jgi:DNA-binding NarL/FixJ family response regulator
MRVLIADEHALFREGLRHVVAEVDTTPKICEAESFDLALKQVRRSPGIDLALISLSLPGVIGFEPLGTLARVLGNAPLVALSASEDPADVGRALAHGVRGYVLKSARGEVLQHVLSLVLAGEIYVPPIVMTQGDFSGVDAAVVDTNANLFDKLTPREGEVLDRLIDGLSNKAIAQELTISEGTVKVHLKAVLRKFDVANRTQAATLALRLGWSGGAVGSVHGA